MDFPCALCCYVVNCCLFGLLVLLLLLLWMMLLLGRTKKSITQKHVYTHSQNKHSMCVVVVCRVCLSCGFPACVLLFCDWLLFVRFVGVAVVAVVDDAAAGTNKSQLQKNGGYKLTNQT